MLPLTIPRLKRAELLDSLAQLPAFPKIITHLLHDLDNDRASMHTLAHHVEQDPVLTGRILSIANRMLNLEGRPHVHDVYTAVSLLGCTRIRQVAMTSSVAEIAMKAEHTHQCWTHSLAVGIAAQELARDTHSNPDYALVAGLLHDIGHIWMACLQPAGFQQIWQHVAHHPEPLCEAEHHLFGMDHCEVGRLIAEYWDLPTEIVSAIYFHHAPDHRAASQKLVALTHVAEVVSNALDLPSGKASQVTHLSHTAVRTLNLDWGHGFTHLLGRIEARHAYARQLFH